MGGGIWEKSDSTIENSQPVEIPQLKTHTLSRGAAGLILATHPTCTTVYSLNVEVPTKWYIGFPLIRNLDLPSPIMTPLSVFILSRSHMLLSSDLQCRHSLHSPVKTGRTWSPGARSVTPSPTLSTILYTNKKNPINTHEVWSLKLTKSILWGYNNQLWSTVTTSRNKGGKHTLQLHDQRCEETPVSGPAIQRFTQLSCMGLFNHQCHHKRKQER